METIITYVNSIFQSLPATKQNVELKENMIHTMLEKYNTLINEGKSENEAIGLVISESGNITKQLSNLGADIVKDPQDTQLSLDTVKDFLHKKNTTSLMIAAGVALCIFGVILNVLFDGLATQNIFTSFLDSDGDSILGLAGLFVCVAIAVGLFIYSGYMSNHFVHIQEQIRMNAAAKSYVLEQKNRFEGPYITAIIIGVILCILSPVSSTILESSFGKDNDLCDVPMLSLILIAVFLFVYFGGRHSTYDTLLKTSALTKQQEKTNTLYGVIDGTIMLCATAIYLICGFCFHIWDTSVVVFPVGAILCGIASLIIWGISKK